MTDSAPLAEAVAHVARGRRITALAILIALVAAGLAVHLLLFDTAATDIAGDALYAAAAYVGLVLIWPRLHPLAVGSIALAWCVGVELFQLTGVPLALGAAFPPAMLVLGTAFDARDLVVYTVTIAGLMPADAAARRIAAAMRRRTP